jgi:hypothetical protein
VVKLGLLHLPPTSLPKFNDTRWSTFFPHHQAKCPVQHHLFTKQDWSSLLNAARGVTLKQPADGRATLVPKSISAVLNHLKIKGWNFSISSNKLNIQGFRKISTKNQ